MARSPPGCEWNHCGYENPCDHPDGQPIAGRPRSREARGGPVGTLPHFTRRVFGAFDRDIGSWCSSQAKVAPARVLIECLRAIRSSLWEPSAGPPQSCRFGDAIFIFGGNAIARPLRVNDQIRIRTIRVIDENGEQLGIFPTDEALARARAAGLDRIEISPTTQPPVCKIGDFGRLKYEQSNCKRSMKALTEGSTRLL
ncbi:MAG: translation initiation factor IF-3 [Candidatus Baltobacteraceae bacterium]